MKVEERKLRGKKKKKLGSKAFFQHDKGKDGVS